MRLDESTMSPYATLISDNLQLAFAVLELNNSISQIGLAFVKLRKKSLNNASFKRGLKQVFHHYLTFLHRLELSVEDIVDINTKKLSSRKKRNKIQGDGDDR